MVYLGTKGSVENYSVARFSMLLFLKISDASISNFK